MKRHDSLSFRGRAAAAVFTVAILGSWSYGDLTFSVDITSAVPPGGDDILAPGPVIVAAGAGGGIDVDAMSYASNGKMSFTGAFFGVSPGSTGIGGTAVATQTGGDEPADIFFSGFMGTNIQSYDGDGSSGPPLGLPEPFLNNLDALDMSHPPAGTDVILFSVTPGTISIPSGPYAGFTPSTIFSATNAPGYSGAPAPFASGALLGLSPMDDINALHYMEDGATGPTPGDEIYFSLAPGSPTLASLGVTPGAILLTSPGGAASVFKDCGAVRTWAKRRSQCPTCYS